LVLIFGDVALMGLEDMIALQRLGKADTRFALYYTFSDVIVFVLVEGYVELFFEGRKGQVGH
jgi:hypothetical protein